MHPRTALVVAILSAACTPKDPAETAGDDTGEGTSVSFTISEGGRLGLILTWLDMDAYTLGEPVVAEALETSTVTVDVPVPDAAHLAPFQGSGTLQAAWLMPSLHLELDGDGVQDADEAYEGVGGALLLYLEGTIPEELASAGLGAGWNAVNWTPGPQGTWSLEEVLDLGGVPLFPNLRPREVLSVGGTYAGAAAPDGLRLVLSSMYDLMNPATATTVADEPLVLEDDAWSLEVNTPPPPSHLEEDERFGWDVALEMLLVYEDDGSGGYSMGDVPRYMACANAGFLAPRYLPAPTVLEQAFQIATNALRPGWTAEVRDPKTQSSTALSEAEAAALVISDACMPPPPK